MGAGSCPHHKSAMYRSDKWITLSPFQTIKIENTKTHSLAHTLVLLTQSHLLLSGAFTDSEWFGAVPSGGPLVCVSCTDPL